MSHINFIHTYDDIISIENFLEAWKEFIKRKRKRKDVQEFALHLFDNIFFLHEELRNKIYNHGIYTAFNINDPKPRNIHKASVRDRLLHRALYRKLYLFFDNKFISDSYSCRDYKGTHKAINRFTIFHRKVSKNNTKTCWVLKCDIRKFFASIDQLILLNIISKYIIDKEINILISKIVNSFYGKQRGIGLPLGNLTSQLFVNTYMNEFDQYIKHKIKAKYYIRYADDFVILSEDRKWLENILPQMADFLQERLKLSLHPNKVFIKTISSGIDFLGWIHFPKHRVLRTTTKKRMFRNIQNNPKPETLASYLGMLKHGNAKKLENKIKTLYNTTNNI